MLPLKDMNPTRRFPVLTYTIIAINVLVFLWELSLPPDQLEAALTSLSVVPARVSADPFSLDSILSVIRGMFFHGYGSHCASAIPTPSQRMTKLIKKMRLAASGICVMMNSFCAPDSKPPSL